LQPVLIFLLQLNQVRDFHAAWPAPRSPKIQQYYLPMSAREIHSAPVDALNRELRRQVWIAYKPNHRLALLFLPARLGIVSGLGYVHRHREYSEER
jgi:hypothetical protein